MATLPHHTYHSFFINANTIHLNSKKAQSRRIQLYSHASVTPGDAVHSFDIVTSKPISTPSSDLSKESPPDTNKSPRQKDSYDFFGPRQALKILEERSTKKDASPHPSSSPSNDNNNLPVRPSFRASPLLAEFQKQQQRSTTTKILFLDEGGEFRAVLGAVLLRHMLSRLRTTLDIHVDWKSLGQASGRGLRDHQVVSIMKSMQLPLTLLLDPSSSSFTSTSSLTAASESAPHQTMNPHIHADNTQYQQVFYHNQFDEITDSVKYDLIIVMDRFDYQEVLREVAVLDTINPGGYYAGRIRLLGPFGMNAKGATPGKVLNDIADPLYYHSDGDLRAEKAALQVAAKELAFSCRGLISYLVNLQAKCGSHLTLRDALGQSLRCPLLTRTFPTERDHYVVPKRANTSEWQSSSRGMYVYDNDDASAGDIAHHVSPVAISLGNTSMYDGIAGTSLIATAAATRSSVRNDHFFTIREVNGQRRVVRRPSRHNGYWKDPHNVEMELRAWMEAHNYAGTFKTTTTADDGATSMYTSSKNSKCDHLPTQQQLRQSGASSLATAIDKHGGLAVFSHRMGVSLACRRPNGYWDSFENLSNALRAYLQRRSRTATTTTARRRKRRSSSTNATEDDADLQQQQQHHQYELMLPTQKQLVAAGRADLLRGIRYHGGSARVAERMGVGVRKANGWTEIELKEELTALLPETENVTRARLIDLRRKDLVGAVDRLGGFPYFRRIMGRGMDLDSAGDKEGCHTKGNASDDISSSSSMETSTTITTTDMCGTNKRKPRLQIDIVASQVHEWMKKSRLANRVPTHAELIAAQHEDLWAAAQRCGGMKRVAEYLNVNWVETRGRRRKYSSSSDEDADGGMDGQKRILDPREEIDILDAYEEVVFIP